jgi:hydrogenase nickel incorporation protein HypA/HybF
MHELSIALNILDLAAEQAERHGGGRVAAIHLRLGPGSGVLAEALRSAYELARETCAMNATELMIEEIPLVAYCAKCAAEQTLASPQALRCPVCGTPTPDIVRGRELEIVALELEQ